MSPTDHPDGEAASRQRAELRPDELLRLIFDSAFDGISVHEERPERGPRKLLECNDRFAEMAARPKDELLAMDDTTLVQRPVDKMSWVAGNDGKRDGRPYKGLMSWLRPDGKDNIIEFTAVPVWVGDRLLTVGIDRDITEKRRAQEALRESEARLRATIESLPFDFFALDEQGRYVLQNRACREHWGDVVGKTPEEMAPSKDVLAVWADNNRRAFAGETVSEEVEYTIDSRKGFYHNIIGPIRDRGQVRGILGVNMDVTERKRAEGQRRAMTAGLRAVLAATDELMACPDTDTLLRRAVEIGREKLGLERCSVYLEEGDFLCGTYGTDRRGCTADERAHLFSTDVPRWREYLRLMNPEEPRWIIITSPYYEIVGGRVVELGEGWVGVTPIQAHRGRKLTGVFFNDTAISRSPVDEVKQEVLAVYCSVLDSVMERKREEQQRLALEAQVQHAQKLESLGVLAGGIAHDFNNLLAGVLGFADLALNDLEPESPARGSIEQAIAVAKRAADLTNQMLAYSGRGQFVISPVDVTALVGDMSHLLEVSVSKGAVLKYRLAAGLPPVEADATQLRQIVMNLVTNASESIGDGSGMIAVTTGAMHCDRACLAEACPDEHLPEGTYVCVEVSDTGSGMDEETTARVFDPFFTTKFMGRGLGLAAVHGIVRGHRGVIRIHSEPGSGSTFQVLLPCSERAADAEEAAPAPGGTWRGTGTMLVVDDEETVRTLARRMLERLGFTVLTAVDGRDAVSVFRAHADEIDAVLLDLTMPHMSGEEAFREMRRLRSNVCVILSSGYNEQEATRHFAGTGLAGFIQKPYRLADLRSRLRRALGN